ncbi:stealth conserved region 3 domain-containing protein [Glutamicibacter soli]|uniref:stealth family protein n=1 Tax=Glutamicibacter soli TaxID=453836 RepID=UPI003C734E2C
MPALRSIVKRLRVKEAITTCFSEDAYLSVRRFGLILDSKIRSSEVAYKQSALNRSEPAKHRQLPKSQGLRWTDILPIIPSTAYNYNYLLITNILSESAIRWWEVKGINAGRLIIGVSEADREDTLKSLAQFAEVTNKPLYAMNAQGKNPQIAMNRIDEIPDLAEVAVLRCVSPRRSMADGRKYGFAYGVDVEFWKLPENDGPDALVVAPRENSASRIMSNDDFKLVETNFDDHATLVPAVFQKSFLEEIDFEIDAVYTWVDGDDANWQEERLRLQAEVSGSEFHPEAVHAARFRSRDELKYSLRSIQYFAPWFRNIYIVTADQVPKWLDTNHPKIKVISHREIFHENDLPTFNSNAIISRLHHIPGLTEHFVYINDDVLFGMPVTKQQFFTSGGIARVSPSNNRRPFGEAAAGDGPHFNLTKNIRFLLEREFGKTISRAIKHTPHPMIKSLHFEMEEKFPEAYQNTWSSKFRHHTDIVADQLHHYYAQLVGKAVPGDLSYNYINILDNQYSSVLKETLANKNRQAFCINDAPVEGATPINEDEIEYFFESYFPVKSEFEK